MVCPHVAVDARRGRRNQATGALCGASVTSALTLAAAQVGGLGIAPGANIGDGYAVFEATHGTAPKYADKDVINPGSVIL